MAFEFDRRAKILVGVVVLAAVGAGAWFFFLEEFLNPPPPKVAAKAPAKPAAAAKAGPGAAKPAAAAPKTVADAAKAAAKPIPTDPDKLIAEVVATSGVVQYLRSMGHAISGSAAAGSYVGAQIGKSDETAAAIDEIERRLFEPGAMAGEVAKNLKVSFDAGRLTRFLEFLRQPEVQKLAAVEGGGAARAKDAGSAERQKLIAALDDITKSTELGVAHIVLAARELNDAIFSGLQKAKQPVSRETRQQAGSRVSGIETAYRGVFRDKLRDHFRDVSDAELGAYVKGIDTDMGRSGWELLADAARPALESRARAFGREMASYMLTRQMAALMPQKPAAPVAEEKPAATAAADAKPAQAAPAPVQPVGYQRAANVRELYTRYNDLITATVMRDRAAVKELLDDGKYPNVRQKDGMTPLMIAAANGDTEVAGMLLAKGADPNLRATGATTALSLARERGKTDMVRLLQSRGAKD
ncbi:MAG: ankyrin repeat domain-containing protein [Betaproteobacteria bacterium]|nr:ankyrin repeat domain-containing protein [Betaproteobacteria bacterium]